MGGGYLDKAGLKVALKAVKEYIDNANESASIQSMTCTKIWEGTSYGGTNSIASGTFISKDYDYIFILLFARNSGKIADIEYPLSNNAGMLISHTFAKVSTGSTSVSITYTTTDDDTTTTHILSIVNRCYSNGESNKVTVQETNFPSDIYYKCEIYGIKATVG